MVDIQHITNYDIFQHFKCNRPISEKHVKTLMADPTFPENFKYHPIIVNENFYIVDGQHRCECARRLKIPVYFVIHAGATEKDIKNVNTQQKYWDTKNFQEYFAGIGQKEYQFLNSLKKYNFAGYLNALICRKIEGYSAEEFVIKFKKGEIEFEKKHEIIEFMNIFAKEMNLMKSYHQKTISHLFTQSYFEAFIDLYLENRDLFDELMFRLNKVIRSIPEARSIPTCKYNLKNAATRTITKKQMKEYEEWMKIKDDDAEEKKIMKKENAKKKRKAA